MTSSSVQVTTTRNDTMPASSGEPSTARRAFSNEKSQPEEKGTNEP
jgi:hypothetical protein